MSFNKSENLGLHLWEGEDDFLRTEFNENFQAIDAGVKAEETARKAAVQAEQDARESAIQQVKDSITSTGGSASQAVEALRSELTSKISSVQQEAQAAQSAADAAQATADAAWAPDNPYYVSGSYVGTGTYGTDSPTRITVGFPPAMVLLYGTSIRLLIPPITSLSNYNDIIWEDTGVAMTSIADADGQFNGKGKTYYYFAFR